LRVYVPRAHLECAIREKYIFSFLEGPISNS
jgi:hypothetical protein